MKKLFKLQAFAVAVIIAVAGFFPVAAHGSNTKQVKEEIIEYNLKEASADSVQSWLDGELAKNAGIGSEWYVLALSKSGGYNFSSYKAALLEYLANNEVHSASTRLKYALTLVAVGGKNEAYVAKTVEDSIGKQGIMSLIFGLHLLNNGCESSTYSTDSLINEILALQSSDGGWSLTGEQGDTDVTAMTVQALAVYYGGNSAVKSAVDGALDFLSACQQDNGGYLSYGINNPESAAQVLVALTSLGIDASTDGRFIKNGKTVFDAMNSFRLPDGSYCHKQGGNVNSMATVQVLCAHVAFDNAKNGDRFFYVFKEKATPAPEEIITSEPVTVVEAETVITKAETVSDESETTLVEAKTDLAETTTSDSTNQSEKFGIRQWIAVIAAVAALAVCAVLFITKKRNPKDYIIILVVAALVIILALFVKLETVDEHYSGTEESIRNTAGTVTISISCDVIKGKGDHVPQDGIILAEVEVEFEEGDTVYNVLSRVCAQNKIHIETSGAEKTVYIEGINNIYETDFGDLSGWKYLVNGNSPSVSCGDYELADGDVIEWCYTLELV